MWDQRTTHSQGWSSPEQAPDHEATFQYFPIYSAKQTGLPQGSGGITQEHEPTREEGADECGEGALGGA